MELNTIRHKNYKDLLKVTPMYEKLQKDFEDKNQFYELEKKKKILNTIRNLRKPIDKKGMFRNYQFQNF